MKFMSQATKNIIWKYWKSGVAIVEISKSTQLDPSNVRRYLVYHGGIKPRERVRTKGQLSLSEREEISLNLVLGKSIRSIARQLGRAPSTISREVKRNGGASKYRATKAERSAWRRAKRPKPSKFEQNEILVDIVIEKLREYWSPEQIAGWLKQAYPTNKALNVSHETIYKSLYIQGKGLFRKELMNHLRTRRKLRHSKQHVRGNKFVKPFADGLSISERPAEVEDRAIPGHWEGDLIQGSRQSYIATLVERQTRFTIMVKVPGKETLPVVSALSEQMFQLPNLLKKSLTWDRGCELAAHKKFSMATNMKVYFCDPSSPWQRGSNENTNKLLRQYFPKGTYLGDYSQEDLDNVAASLNNRPRKTLGFNTPADKINELLH